MRLSLLLIIIGILLSSCSETPFQSTSEQIEAEISTDKLNISNNTETTIYYFAIDRDFAAYATWVPTSTEENAIKSKEMKKLSLSEIRGYEQHNKVILYYWTSENPKQNEISNIIVKK